MHNFNAKSPINVPDQWIYKYYLDFNRDMDGSTIRLTSPFGTERTPSMFLYVKHGRYVWKDHSSGKYGDALDLARQLFQHSSGEECTWKATMATIRFDYDQWKYKMNNNEEYRPVPIEVEKYAYELVCEFETDSFETWDERFWSPLGIGEELLDEFCVRPLRKFRLGKQLGPHTIQWGPLHEIAISYGYFLKDGTLIKIYNPHTADLKHITLKNDVLGREQMKCHRTTIIGSSLKDVLCLRALGLELDVLAPIGEKVLIDSVFMGLIKETSQDVLTLFDNDKTGLKAMAMYKSVYDLDFVYVPHYKDLAEFKEVASDDFMRAELTISINKKLKGNAQNIKAWEPVPGFISF